MKQLMIMRHCATQWGSSSGTDHDRHLSPDGERDAMRMGRLLGSGGWIPDRIIASSAIRARKTAELAAQAGEWGIDVEIEPSLYGAHVAGVLDLVSGQPDDLSRLLIVGHEPCCSALTNEIVVGCGASFPTGGIAAIELNESGWCAIAGARGRLLWFVNPQTKSSMSLKGTSGSEKSGR